MSESFTAEKVRRALANPDKLVVLRINKADYDRDFWIVPQTAAQIEAWWIAQPTLNRSPVSVMRFDENDRERLPLLEVPGTFLHEMDQESYDLWDELEATGKHYSCVFCCDCDSYLRRPDGTDLFHPGRTFPRVLTPEEEEADLREFEAFAARMAAESARERAGGEPFT